MHPDGTINWAYIFITLSVRLFGIVLLLAIMYVGISLASKIISKFFPAKPK